jgi:hypothetical protein
MSDTPTTYIGGPRDGQVTSSGTTYSQSASKLRDKDGYRLFETYVGEGGRLVFKGYLRSNEGQPPKPPPEPVTPEASSALTQRSAHYPARYGARVPRRVRLLRDVGPTPSWPP